MTKETLAEKYAAFPGNRGYNQVKYAAFLAGMEAERERAQELVKVIQKIMNQFEDMSDGDIRGEWYTEAFYVLIKYRKQG